MKRIPFLTAEEIALKQAQEAASDKSQKKTAEQIEAIYSSGQNILVSASAGSGKTFVMVQRIIDQILRGVAVRQLFISTFTVKAAGELKERLEKELGQALKEAKSPELKQHLAQQLADLPNADIGTMDAFTQKVFSRYGYLLGLAPNFRILQSASEQLILQNEVFSQVFDCYYASEHQALFSRLVKNFTGKRKDLSGFREQVYRIYSFLQSTSSPQRWLEETFLYGYEHSDFAAERERIFGQIKSALWELEAFFSAHLEHEGREFVGAKYQENVQDALTALAGLNELPSIEETAQILKQIVALSQLSNGQAFTARVGKNADELKKEMAKDYNEARKPMIERLRSFDQQLYQLDFIEQHQDECLPLVELLRDFVADFAQAYLERKKAENAFEFGDISHFAIEILERFPEVHRFYQERYHEVMVDEYQDTNHTQERMLDLLSRGQNRFMVGDIKQSIYRFRQADPQIFSDKFKAYQEDSSQGKLIVLKENFRSHLEVLEATNDVFKRLMDEEVGEIDYNETHYLVAGNPAKREPNPANRASFLIYEGSKESLEEEADEGLPQAVSAGEVDLVIKEIIRLHNEEGVAFKDITLLTASRTRNDLILAAFEQHQIPLVPDDGAANYLQSVEVLVMLDTLRTINNPLNDYALTALLKSPMFDFGEDELARLSLQASQEHSQENLYEKFVNALEGRGLHPALVTQELQKKLQHFHETLQDWRTYSKTHSLYDLIWKIYQDRFYYDMVGTLANGAQRQANLYALSLRANEYEKSSFKGLSRFIGMIDRILENQHDLASVPVAAPKDAVRLMTIHKSKGLEFKYVFLLNMDKAFNRQDSSSAIILSRTKGVGIKYVADVSVSVEDPYAPNQLRISMDTLPYQQNLAELQLASLSEQMRLLYVAMTRAETKLYLVGKGSQEALDKRQWGKSQQGRLSASLRSQLSNFQDWLYAIQAVFSDENLAYETRFVTDEELTAEEIGRINEPLFFPADDLADNRQSDDIRRALDILESVDRLNSQYRSAIELPSVRTPSQIKKFYEPIMDTDGLDIMDERAAFRPQPNFDLPDFGKKAKVTGAQVGSAVHELMQRIPLDSSPSMAVLRSALTQVQADEAVKKQIQLPKIASFFETDLGRLLIENSDRVRREAPFAMLKRDDASGQNFVLRGILDGYLLFEDRIILFDYKTDKYKDSSELIARYCGQLDLYAQALSRSYGISQIEKYLILLGGEQLQVVKVD
ncbi:helicase-exonuclease AddAB subunit AddA [Streptococcus sanguinis]|uniref:ATP-dependent helicase/nuclease subunit A n=1 Tax=Streptococcus sanguinis SK115 TaxID=888810 RepID=F0I6J0_STRSA|nr:helicase-exonuclease AddAB subunit AddA [Streptococcus sanguinis]EGD32490.1 exonuclease RexA [Streptococcus sanguinis SK115]MBZ2051964.1 helicase-exonuclease AddAB subunit AddA [Streptococcus sanguinis]